MISCAGRPRIGRVGVASCFSPRFLPLLSDAAGISERCQAALSILHAGPESSAETFMRAVDQLQVSSSVTLVSKEDQGVVETLVGLAQKESLDLLVAGALANQRPSDGLPDDVARSLLRHTPCPLFLFTEPRIHGTKFKRVVVATDFGPEAENALQAAYWLAAGDQAESLIALTTFNLSSGTNSRRHTHRLFESGTIADVEERLEAFVSPLARGRVPIATHVVSVGKGLSVHESLQKIEPDLLVIPARRDSHGGIFLPPGLEWIFQTVPCNLWIMPPHKRKWGSSASLVVH